VVLPQLNKNESRVSFHEILITREEAKPSLASQVFPLQTKGSYATHGPVLPQKPEDPPSIPNTQVILEANTQYPTLGPMRANTQYTKTNIPNALLMSSLAVTPANTTPQSTLLVTMGGAKAPGDSMGVVVCLQLGNHTLQAHGKVWRVGLPENICSCRKRTNPAAHNIEHTAKGCDGTWKASGHMERIAITCLQVCCLTLCLKLSFQISSPINPIVHTPTHSRKNAFKFFDKDQESA
jgi:hypothetical protein